MLDVRRRDFITLLGGAAAAWPLAARAQQPAKIARIGFLGATTPAGIESRLERFRAGLRDLAYVEGKNILIDFRWAEGNYARLAEYAAELVRLRVDILVTYGTPGTLAAKQATETVPIVMLVSGDAVATGIIASLARPGGNVTGSTFFDPELNAKRLELIKEISPSAKRIAVLVNPGNPVNAPIIQAMERTAERLRLELQTFEARTADEFQSVVSNIAKQRDDAVAVTQDPLFVSNITKIAEIARNNRLAAIGFVEFAQVGGLIGYGPNMDDLWYRGAYFVDKILKGTKPADLPVEQPTKFELVINLKTAKALGVTVPPTLLARADEVIE
jgi:putative ABC transport system substrate-binding protein